MPLIILALLSIGHTASTNEKKCIGFITGSHDKYWDEMFRGIKEAAYSLDYHVRYRGLNTEINFSGQSNAVNNFSSLGCVALVIAPNHPDRSRDVLALQEQGVIVVFVDRGLSTMPDMPVIATDNYSAGQFAGMKMLEMLSPEAKNIAVFRLAKGVESTTAREQGFIDYIQSNGLKIVLDAYVGTQVGQVKHSVIRKLSKSSIKIDGIFTPNETTTVGTADVLTSKPHGNRPILIGFDYSKQIKSLMKAGKIDGVVMQNPYQMGYRSIQLIDSHLKSGEIISSETIEVDFME